ncbi:uncharacterized protein N7459_009873 [Penicillium hispanicum]|uniref:uncharacterized protein n=1 Tax=Penicillium hispanicum TaxID=1080232 RepID=UPI0025420FAC|nr:uncharacterized protein N7459_009873 [Penicillium hispanicum]KAJ5570443.1 hypothetical protein N7459_009873 [Penicillium hispanicum]
MHMKFLVGNILAIASTSSALGINCRGSSNCGSVVTPCDGDQGMSALQFMQGMIKGRIDQGHGNDFYSEGKQIACTLRKPHAVLGGGCCLFYQNGASGTLNDVLVRIDNLVDHGCETCGSDPTQPGNDVGNGELTVNYVSSANCPAGDFCSPS